jgi:deazaflavin-dependent oxidoreductase (nitroreductase family)
MNLNRWLYRGGRPNRVARALNRAHAAIWATGVWSSRMNTIEVRGRRTGKPISLPLVVANLGGERYLVAMLGAGASWVANVRAARGHAVLRHGVREPVYLDEVPPDERAPILRRYLEVAPGARKHFPLDRHASAAEFDRIAARYPVFHVLPETSPSEGVRPARAR